MAQPIGNEDGSGAVPRVDIAITNDKSVGVEIFRIDPVTFEEESRAALAPGQTKSVSVWLDDCLVAKAGDEVMGEFGVSGELSEWRLRDTDSENGPQCTVVVENQRAERVMLFRTPGDNAEPVRIRALDAGELAILESFSGDYWEAKIGDRVVAAYQPSARLPVWEIIEVDCEFVPELPDNGNTNLNETNDPRPEDLTGVGVVKAVMVFVDFPDVVGSGSLDDVKKLVKLIVGDSEDWFWRESYGRLEFVIETPVLQWRRMPGPAADYAAIKHDWQAHQSYIATALKLFSTDEIRFDQYQVAYVVAAATPENDPAYQEVLHNSPTLSAGIPVATHSGTIHHAVTFGRDAYTRGCRVLIHETGHLLGLPDLYLFNPEASGEFRGPVGCWDIMCDLDQGRHLLGWHKYKLNWLDESQLVYFTSGELETTLTSFDTAQGVKMILLPSEQTSQLYVIEVAQPLAESDEFRDKGLLIYTVDAAVPTGHEPVRLLKCGTKEGDERIGLRCHDFLAPGQTRMVTLANGARFEVINRRQVDSDFEVAVRCSGVD
ncbi:MAG: hypothetical protein FJ145_13420 [Deltaproteobacteria bacterium]|nr:hypothetical protein [Deltaproteobacteria bacterium]